MLIYFISTFNNILTSLDIKEGGISVQCRNICTVIPTLFSGYGDFMMSENLIYLFYMLRLPSGLAPPLTYPFAPAGCIFSHFWDCSLVKYLKIVM